MITNVAKHALRGPPRSSSPVLETCSRSGSATSPGGADPAGSGLSGLRGRVESVDGKLLIESPSGGGTTITAELPCE